MSPAILDEPDRRSRERYWLHLLLLGLTFLTTSAIGSHLTDSFERNTPPFSGDEFFEMFRALAHPADLVRGLPFSLTLLSILLAHEMGHYLACMYYRIDASLPYFLPAPTPIGTLGAFIRIRAAIYHKKELFDIGIAGPLAGFAFVVPALGIGLAFSKVIPGIAQDGDLIFGKPWIQRLLELVIFPGVSGADIYLHPVARAAWVGVLATALNLLPIGQLDGGHILYSFIGDSHRLVSRLFIFGALFPLGIFFSRSWLVWAVLLLLFGMKHPRIYDTASLGQGRVQLGVLALGIFVICFTLSPITVRG